MGFKIDKTVPPMERELAYLLYDLCVNWGFCIPPVRAEELRKLTYLSAEEFAINVVEAEGMNPEYESKWVRRIANKFRERFGVEEILSPPSLIAFEVTRSRGRRRTMHRRTSLVLANLRSAIFEQKLSAYLP